MRRYYLLISKQQYPDINLKSQTIYQYVKGRYVWFLHIYQTSHDKIYLWISRLTFPPMGNLVEGGSGMQNWFLVGNPMKVISKRRKLSNWKQLFRMMIKYSNIPILQNPAYHASLSNMFLYSVWATRNQ